MLVLQASPTCVLGERMWLLQAEECLGAFWCGLGRTNMRFGRPWTRIWSSQAEEYFGVVVAEAKCGWRGLGNAVGRFCTLTHCVVLVLCALRNRTVFSSGDAAVCFGRFGSLRGSPGWVPPRFGSAVQVWFHGILSWAQPNMILYTEAFQSRTPF